jgi:uncharacterized membrane protein YuzA (DUF378 family)
MTSTQTPALKFTYFVLGIAGPIAALVLWKKLGQPEQRKHEIDRAHDVTVEDSFPASDPPSSW